LDLRQSAVGQVPYVAALFWATRSALITYGHLPQTGRAQAVAACGRHRQGEGLLHAPALAGRVAAECRAASGADEAAGW
jgi:hypothetical protein